MNKLELVGNAENKVVLGPGENVGEEALYEQLALHRLRRIPEIVLGILRALFRRPPLLREVGRGVQPEIFENNNELHRQYSAWHLFR